MKIAFVGPASSIHTQRWVSAFADRGHDVSLLSLHPPRVGVVAENVSLSVLGSAPLGYVTKARRLGQLIDDLVPDVISVHYASGYGTLATLARRHPLVLSVWGSDVFEFPDTSPLHRELIKSNLRHADRITSTSEVMRRRTAALLANDGRPIDVVPFGVDCEAFTPRSEPRESSRTRIGTVKSLASKYGIDDLIRSFAVATSNGLDAELVIAGDGPDRQALEGLAASEGIAGRTQFLGPITHPEVPEVLRSLDVFVALSTLDSESFGVSVIEASGCGLPVVVSDVGGLPEVVADGVSGFVVRRRDTSAAAARILELASDEELRRRLGAAGRDLVLAHYQWSACVDRMEQVFRSVRASPSSTRS